MSTPRQDFWRLEFFDVLASTSDQCRCRAAAGEPEGLAVVARAQSAGRGSRGRGWASPAGNLFLSALLRPGERARDAAQWSLLAGVALAEALAPYVPDSVALRLKWPNDVLLAGKKLAGILVDSGAGADGELDWLVIGIGVNLAVAPEVPWRGVACLADVAVPPAPEAFAPALLARMDHWREIRRREGFAPVRAGWLAHASAPGSRVTLRRGDALLAGDFAGLGDDGALLLETGGRVRAFATGEVLHC